jgi:hypothetical protein
MSFSFWISGFHRGRLLSFDLVLVAVSACDAVRHL